MKAARLFLAPLARGAGGPAATASSLNSSAFFSPHRYVTINSKTTFKRLPGQTAKEAHSNFAEPGEKEEGEIDLRSWLGKKRPDEKVIPFGEFSLKSKRCGALARKIGMMNTWDARGVRTTLTVLRMENCQVVDIKKSIAPRSKEHKVNLLVGAGAKDVRELNKGQMVAFRKAQLDPKEKLVEFPITLDAILPVGTRISARHFVPGQYLDLVGTSKDKGFAGVMKRHGFKGQLASHGVSLTHRHLGSTGACQNPSKVWPGKKMPGHMGNKRCTFNNMQLYKIDVERDLLFIRGSVPGKNGSWVHLQDAVRRPWIESKPPPFPTFEPVEGEEDPHEIIMDVSHLEDIFIHG